MNFKKELKIIAGVVVLLTLPSLLFFGYLYFKYHEDLPIGTNPEQANVLAQKMLDALDHESYKNTNYIEWMYRKKRLYKWKKDRQSCLVYWKDYKVNLDLKDYSQSQAYVHNFNAEGEIAQDLIEKAQNYFKNDLFWMTAPYTVFDEGVERRIVSLEDGTQGLLVTYPSERNIPAGSFLWHLNSDGKPTSFQLWVSELPIDGLKISWNDWTTTESGAQLATNHKLWFFNIEIEVVKGTN